MHAFYLGENHHQLHSFEILWALILIEIGAPILLFYKALKILKLLEKRKGLVEEITQ